MSKIKSERAKAKLVSEVFNPYYKYGGISEDRAYYDEDVELMIIIAEQDAEERARKAFANIMKKFIGLLPVEALETEFEQLLIE